MKNILATILVSMMATTAMASAQIGNETSVRSIYASGKYLSLESPGILVPAGVKSISNGICSILLNDALAEDSILSAGRSIEALQMGGVFDPFNGYTSLYAKNDKTVSGISFKGQTVEELEKNCGLKATIRVRTDLQEASLQQ